MSAQGVLYGAAPSLDLARLRYFVAVAEHGSLTAAARALGLTQPSLSMAMQLLERDLGTKLLLRDRSGVTPTATGVELLRRAPDLLGLVHSVEQRLRSLESGDTGAFTVGCHESLGAYFLPGFLASFLPAHPRIELQLANESSAAVRAAVISRAIDFGIVVNPLSHPELVVVPLCEDAVDLHVAVEPGPPGQPKRSRKQAYDRLRLGPLVYAGRVAQSRKLIDALSAEGLLPDRHLVCGDLELVKSILSAGVGVGLLPRRVAAYGQPDALERLHASMPFVSDTIALLYRSDMHRTGAAQVVKNALVQYGKKLPKLATIGR
jgi:DNA-binding transcriptional LysR family regulator